MNIHAREGDLGNVDKGMLRGFAAFISFLFLMGMLSLSWPATAEELPKIPIPEEDYGVWVPEGEPCSATPRVEVGKNEIRLQFGDREAVFRNPDVNLGCASGTAVQSKAHCIFLDLPQPSFHLFFFPGDDLNKLSYEIIRPKRLPPGFPSADFDLRRCQ